MNAFDIILSIGVISHIVCICFLLIDREFLSIHRRILEIHELESESNEAFRKAYKEGYLKAKYELQRESKEK